MKKLMVFIFIFLTLEVYSQNSNFALLEGVWMWRDSISDSEFIIQLKKRTFQRPAFFGGGIDTELVGGYRYKKNGVILIDKLSEVSTNKTSSIDYSVRIMNSKNLSLGVRDYLTKNGRGEFKYIGPSSRVEIISLDTPMQIHWILNDKRERIVVGLSDEEVDSLVFPDGTALPTDLVLTKIE